MKLLKAYKTELQINNKQRTVLLQHAGTARFVWNWALNRVQQKISKPNAMQINKEWNEWKRINAPWWKSVSKCSPQESLCNLERAFDNFFRRCKAKKSGKYKGKVGFPKFKSKKKNGIGSFTLRGIIHVFYDSIQLPRLGIIKLKENNYIPTKDIKILSATISEKAGRWFVSVQVEETIVDPLPKPKAIVGIDLGIKILATCSDGITFKNSKALKRNLRKLKHLQRLHSKKQKGGKNREKARKKLAKLHYRISNIRKDCLHKITTNLTKSKSVIVIEDLNVSGMMKNHCWAQSISDVGMYEFRRQLEYKGKWYGCQIVVADKFFPSSKKCHVCGHVKEDLVLSDRSWTCEKCQTYHERDMNAAKNLEQIGRKVAGSLPETLNACGEGSSGSDANDQNETTFNETRIGQKMIL